MRSDRRGLTVLSLVIILIVVGLLAFVLLRSRGPASQVATPDAPPATTVPTDATVGGVLTAVREPDPSMAAGSSDTVSVRLANGAGVPMIGIPVGFAVETGGGAVDTIPVRTDSTGLARAVWRFGAEPGVNSLRITAEAPRTQIEPLVLFVTTYSP